MAGISLSMEYLSPEDYFPGVHPVRVTADNDEAGLDSSIFVFHAQSETNPMPGDFFECVASYQQMQELPIDTPVLEGDNPIPFYRKSVVEYYLTDPAELEDIWSIIQSDVKLLVNSARFWNKINTQVDVTIDPP